MQVLIGDAEYLPTTVRTEVRALTSSTPPRVTSTRDNLPREDKYQRPYADGEAVDETEQQ